MVTCEPSGDAEFHDAVEYVVDERQIAREANNEKSILEAETVAGDDIATILYTSGTTGAFKFLLSHKFV